MVPFEPTLYDQRAAASMRIDTMRDSYRNGIRCKGFTISAVTGSSFTTIDLSGMAKHFVGFGFYFPPVTTGGASQIPIGGLTTQLVINNDVVCDSVSIAHLTVNPQNHDRAFYQFERMLNGQDTIVFNFINSTGAAVNNFQLNVYYI
jgi:hypothetical protein